MAVALSIVEAVIAAAIAFTVWHLERKIDQMERDNAARDRKQIELRAAERDLLYAEAKISALTARVVRGELVNGDLEKAERELNDKKKALSDLTNTIVAEFLEG